jgi:DNA-binding beta-propeller fold protein YncE
MSQQTNELENTMNQPTIAILLLSLATVWAQVGSSEPLKLETTIPMADVQGRIDHLSVDLQNRRLFVAALGNNTVEVLDIKGARRLHTISGLHEPQGVLYVPGENRLFVANAKDGTCRIYDATSFQLLQTIEYGDDADNIRFDEPTKQVYVGYGSGALGILDFSGKKLGDMKLDAHPESFQLEKKGTRIFVNLPDSRKIAVIDRKKKAVVGQWETGGALANFPMALDEANHRLFAVCRRPAVLVVLNTDSGAVIAKIPTVGDSDDVFYDPSRKQIYASGGEGAIAVLQQQDPDHYQEIVPTPPRSFC